MVARTAFTQLNHSLPLLAATVLGLCVVYLAPPLLLFAGGAAAWLGLAAWAAMALAYAPMLRFYRCSLLWAPLLPVVALDSISAATVRSAALHYRVRGGASGRDGCCGKAAQARRERHRRDALGQGQGRREFPGRLLAHPPRAAPARPRLPTASRAKADDIADNPALAPDDKMRRLDRMGAVLDGAPGDDSPAAVAMRASLAATGVTAQHCHDVLRAFRLDATKLRYRDWDDLMEYCQRAIRDRAQLGASSSTSTARRRCARPGPASDALCSALQVLNHAAGIAPRMPAAPSTASICPKQDLTACGAQIRGP